MSYVPQADAHPTEQYGLGPSQTFHSPRAREVLGGVLGMTERGASRQLGVAVFETIGLLVRELLAARVSLVVEGNFWPDVGRLVAEIGDAVFSRS